jgi:tRNA A37 methylthiotransferase MiaB
MQIVKERTKKMMELHEKIALENHEKLIGNEYECIVDKHGFGNTWLARNSDYRLIVLQGNNLLGKFVKVKITKAMPHYLIGKIIEEN